MSWKQFITETNSGVFSPQNNTGITLNETVFVTSIVILCILTCLYKGFFFFFFYTEGRILLPFF